VIMRTMMLPSSMNHLTLDIVLTGIAQCIILIGGSALNLEVARPSQTPAARIQKPNHRAM
jgi:hypothetical protein